MLFDTNEFSLQTHCLIFGSDGCSHVLLDCTAGVKLWALCNILQHLAMVRWLWSLAKHGRTMFSLCPAVLRPAFAKSAWGNRPVRPSTRMNENRTFRSLPPSFLLLSCLFCLGARQSASVSCLRLASEDEHVRMSPSDLVLQVLRGSILGTKPSWHSLCRQICEAAGFIIDISWFHPSNMSNVLQNMLWVEWFTMC